MFFDINIGRYPSKRRKKERKFRYGGNYSSTMVSRVCHLILNMFDADGNILCTQTTIFTGKLRGITKEDAISLKMTKLIRVKTEGRPLMP